MFPKALQVGLFTSDRKFILTNLDAQTIDLTPFQYTGAEITLFRIVQQEEPTKFLEYDEIRNILEQKKIECEQYCTADDIEGKIYQIIILILNEFQIRLNESLIHIKELSPTIHTTNTALIFDAVMLLAEALKQIGSSHIESPDSFSMINCYDSDSTWSKGYTLLNFMKNVRQTPIGDLNTSLHLQFN